MAIYDTFGKQYSTTHVPDYRIVKTITNLLNLPKGSKIADSGISYKTTSATRQKSKVKSQKKKTLFYRLSALFAPGKLF